MTLSEAAAERDRALEHLDPLEWHRKALAGENPPIHEDEPQVGWYVRSTTYRGPLFPARIFWEGKTDSETGELLGDEVLRCELCFERRDPYEEWVWLASRPISEGEYDALIAELFSAPTYIGPQRPRVRWLTEQEKPR